MATEKETVILDFQVEQGSAITELEKTKKSIIQLKQEQLELNKAYKAGDVTLEEYASESVRIEGILKKQTATYSNVQKSVTGVKTQMDKLIDSNKKISTSFEESASKISVAGVSLGDIQTKLVSLANPITAVTALIGALGAAYASSAAGAKDLDSAQSQLSTSFGILSNQLASLLGADGKGGGLLSKFTFALTSQLSFGLAISGKIAADAKYALKELEVLQLVNNRYAKEQLQLSEQQRQIRDNDQNDFNERLAAAKAVDVYVNQREQALVETQTKRLTQLQTLLAFDQNNLDLQKEIKQVEFEISDIREDSEGKRTEALNGINNLYKQQLDLQNKLNVAAEAQDEERRKTARKGVTERGAGASNLTSDAADTNFKILAKNATRELQLYEDTEEGKQDLAQRTSDFRKQLAEEDLAMTAGVVNQAAALLGEQTILGQTLGIEAATINTYQGATLALAELPPPFSFIAAATTIATGLASVAKIAGVDTGIAAAGGTDFVTTKPTMLLVGDNPGGREHVQVTPLSGKGKTRTFGRNGVAMAGGGSLTVDGGAAKNAATSEINQTLAFTNALKSMPTPVVSVKEISKVQKRVSVKEQISRV